MLEQASAKGLKWLKAILDLEHHSNEELARSLTDSPLKVRSSVGGCWEARLLRMAGHSAAADDVCSQRSSHAARRCRRSHPSVRPSPPPAAPSPRSPFGLPRRRPSCSIDTPRRRCWRDGLAARASWSRGAHQLRLRAGLAPAARVARHAWARMYGLRMAWPGMLQLVRLAACVALAAGLPIRRCMHAFASNLCWTSTRAALPTVVCFVCRLPTSHPTLIKFSAPLFLRISFSSLGISFGRTSTRAFVACMSKQVGRASACMHNLRLAIGGHPVAETQRGGPKPSRHLAV